MDEYLEVELKGIELFAKVGIWEDKALDGLHTLFQELAGSKTPWQGAHTWKSLDGEFSLSATCTTLGQVNFLIKLSHLTGSPEDWQIQAG